VHAEVWVRVLTKLAQEATPAPTKMKMPDWAQKALKSSPTRTVNSPAAIKDRAYAQKVLKHLAPPPDVGPRKRSWTRFLRDGQ
jgi:hypothetical protein